MRYVIVNRDSEVAEWFDEYEHAAGYAAELAMEAAGGAFFLDTRVAIFLKVAEVVPVLDETPEGKRGAAKEGVDFWVDRHDVVVVDGVPPELVGLPAPPAPAVVASAVHEALVAEYADLTVAHQDLQRRHDALRADLDRMQANLSRVPSSFVAGKVRSGSLPSDVDLLKQAVKVAHEYASKAGPVTMCEVAKRITRAGWQRSARDFCLALDLDPDLALDLRDDEDDS